MALLEYSGKRRVDEKPLLALMAVNAGFALAIVFAWTVIAILVAEPISWATWTPLPHGTRPDLFDYPFVALWAVPAIGIVAAAFAIKFRKIKAAYMFSMFPMFMLSMISIYFHFVPSEFH